MSVTQTRKKKLRPLPAGRHGLPREFVIANQRERMLEAVMRTISERGYAAMRVEDITAKAGVSRRTFYDHFGNKETAFLSAYDEVVAHLEEVVGGAFAKGKSWPEKVSRAVFAFLSHLARDPTIAHVCIVEVYAAGPNALERRVNAMHRFRQFVVPTDRDVPGASKVPDVMAEALIGGIYEIVYTRVVAGQAAELPDHMPELLHAILLPYLGARATATACKRALAALAESADEEEEAGEEEDQIPPAA